MSFDELPKGKQPMYLALRDAGLLGAAPQRNVEWVNVASDGRAVMNTWRRQLGKRDGQLVAVIDARRWQVSKGMKGAKRGRVIESLSALHGLQIRVVLLEETAPNSRKSSGARFDPDALWLVEDTGDDFVLWRGREPETVENPFPETPKAFGHVVPGRKESVSSRIERDPKVRLITLKRAGNRCEIPMCELWTLFESMDVHHIAQLGHGGSDHTDNTVALCPACHSKVHRGTASVRDMMNSRLEKIRSTRLVTEY